jgi:glycosyltransferase involved in cell wall biosynthesis
VKVLHIITGLDTGGAEALMYRLIRYFPEPDTEHVICSLKGGGAYSERFVEMNVPVHALDGRAVSIARAVPAVARQVKPSLIQGWMYHGNIAAAYCRLSNASRAPQLWSVHQTLSGFKNEKPGTAMVIRAGGLLSGMPFRIIYNSRESARQHEALGYRAEKTTMVASGFDTEVFKPDPVQRRALRAEIGVSDDVPLIGVVGRLHAMKDHGNFLRAAQAVKAVRPDAVFLLAGRGTDSDSIGRRVGELGLSESVRMLGERSDVPAIMAALDLLALPSAWGEAFPTVVGEAMASGVPCVVTDVGDSGHIVGNTGTVVPPRDSEALAQAMLALVRHPHRKVLGIRARERIISQYSLTAMTRKYADLYTELTGS